MTTYRYCQYCLVGIPSRYFKTHGCTYEGERKRLLQAITATEYQWKEIYYTDEEELVP